MFNKMKLNRTIFILIFGIFMPQLNYGEELNKKSSLDQIPHELDDNRNSNNITKHNYNKFSRIKVVHNKNLNSNINEMLSSNINLNRTDIKIVTKINSKVNDNTVNKTFSINNYDTNKSQNVATNSATQTGAIDQVKGTIKKLANETNEIKNERKHITEDAQYNSVQDHFNINDSAEETPGKINFKNVEGLQDVIIINLEPINKMGFVEFLGKRMKALWNGVDSKTLPQNSFVGRCIGVARKLKMMMPWIMMGMGVIATKLVFLLLFSMKSLALLGLLVMMNVATGAAKLGALFASKKHDIKPQITHVHVHPDVIDHHGPHSSGGYWEDRNDFLDINKLERKDLYNLYNKLKAEEYRKQQYLYLNNR